MRAPIRSAFLALAALGTAFAATARADDSPPQPPYGGYDMAIAQTGLPDGWKMAAADAPLSADAKAINDEVKAVTDAKKAHATTVVRQATSTDGKVAVTFVLVDLDGDDVGVAKALEESAGKKGWSYRAMGSPWRGLVVAGPEDARKVALDAQVAYAALLLSNKADGALENRSGDRAFGFASGAFGIDPKNALAAFVLGVMEREMAANNFGNATYEDAAKHLRIAIDKDAHGPLTGEKAFQARWSLGTALLNSKAMEKEALEAMKAAVAAAADLKDLRREKKLGVRYDLACAHSRMKELDEAFSNLTAVLEEDAKDSIQGVNGHWQKDDTDLENMRADPRWKALLTKFDKPAEGGGGDMPGK